MRFSAPFLFLACTLVASSPSSAFALWDIHEPDAGEKYFENNELFTSGISGMGISEVQLQLQEKVAGDWVTIETVQVDTEGGTSGDWDHTFEGQSVGDYKLLLQTSTGGVEKDSVEFEVVPDSGGD